MLLATVSCARPALAQVAGDGSIGVRFDDASLLRDLPSARDPLALLETVEPLAIVDTIGGAGLYAAAPRRVSIHGTSWTQDVFTLDGADVTDPSRGGTPLFLPDLDALSRIDVTSALAPPGLDSPGVGVALTPREPAGRWGGTVLGQAVPAALQQGDLPGGPPSIARFGSFNEVAAVGGGPAGGRLGLSLSGRLLRVRRFERADPVPREDRLLSGSARLVFRAGDVDDLRLLGGAQTVARPLEAAAGLAGEASREDVRAGGGTLGWTHRGRGATVSAVAGLWTARSTPRAVPGAGVRPVDRLVDGPIPLLVFPSRSSRSVWSGAASVAPDPKSWRSLTQTPGFGLQVRRTGTSERFDPSVSLSETVAGIPARVWDYTATGADSRRHAVAVALWGSERLDWRDRIRLDLGVRLEHASGGARGAATGVSWTTLVPRLAMRLRATRAGRLTLIGGFAAYRQRLLLDWLAFGDPAAPQAAIYRWVDRNGDGRLDPDERGPLVARAGPGAGDSLASIDPGLRPPRTRELVAGLEARPCTGCVVTLLGVDRREDDLVESVNVGAPASAYDVRYLPDPGGDILGAGDDQLLPVFDRRPDSFGRDRYLLTNPLGHRTRHQAVELRARTSLGGGRLELLAGATASRTETDGASRGFRVLENDPGVVGELYDDANADVYARGRGFFDRAFTIKLAGAWRAPGDVRVGLVARYQDGQPFARIVVVPDLAQGPEAVQATPRGQIGPTGAFDPLGRALVASGHRFSYTLTLDARLEKGVRVGRWRGALVAEGFNLLGARNEVEEDPVWGPRFREPTALQPSRAFRLGARLDF